MDKDKVAAYPLAAFLPTEMDKDKAAAHPLAALLPAKMVAAAHFYILRFSISAISISLTVAPQTYPEPFFCDP
jgi:hypothetical protein